MAAQNVITIAGLVKRYRGYRIEVTEDEVLITKKGVFIVKLKLDGLKFPALFHTMKVIDNKIAEDDITFHMQEFKKQYPDLMNDWREDT